MKLFFNILAKFNASFLPKYSKSDLDNMGKLQKGLTAYRYWVTKNTLPKEEKPEAEVTK